MYRIELSPGEETVFRSIDELAVAIKRGVVTPRARIFHNASSKWLPIQFHPHYKTALSMPLTAAALVAGPQVKPLSSLSLEVPPEPELPSPVMAAKPSTPAEAPVQKKKPRPDRPAGESRSRRRSKPRRQLRIALVGALLIGGAQWVLSVPLFSRTKAPLLADAQRRLISVSSEALKQVGSPNTAAMIPVLPAAAAEAAPVVLQGTAEPRGRVTAPSFGGTSSIETAQLEPAPSPAELSSAPPSAPDSLLSHPVDSTSGKTLRGVLTTVSGGATPGPPKAAPKH